MTLPDDYNKLVIVLEYDFHPDDPEQIARISADVRRLLAGEPKVYAAIRHVAATILQEVGADG